MSQALPAHPELARAVSEATPWVRAVSGGTQNDRRLQRQAGNFAALRGVTLAPLETVDPGLAERLCVQLLDRELTDALRTKQPDDPREFAKAYFLHVSKPCYSHSTFFNARTQSSWLHPPAANKLVWACRMLRFVMRWAKSRDVQLDLPVWAPPHVAEMSGAALRHNWRRVEAAIGAEDQKRALEDLQNLIQRGYSVNATPFGTTPLHLAAAVGNLPAAQYLYVHGADVHLLAGRPKALAIEVAALNGHLGIVQLLAENGSTLARALHFAAAAGALDVVRYLLGRQASTQLRVTGFPALGAALLTGQHRMAAALLPQTPDSALTATIPEEGCRLCSIADDSTLLHLAAHLGGLRESVVMRLCQNKTLAAMKNKSGETAFDIVAATLKISLAPKHYQAFTRVSTLDGDSDESAWSAAVGTALNEGASAAAVNVRGFTLLDLVCFSGKKDLIPILMDAKAPVVGQGPNKPSSLMWAHWSGAEDAVVKLCAGGASLSNADLEGLQRLRWLSKTLEKEEKKVAEKKESEDAEADAKTAAAKKGKQQRPKKEPSMSPQELMVPDMGKLWGRGGPAGGYLESSAALAKRMAWGLNQKVTMVGSLMENEEWPATAEILDVAKQFASPETVTRAKLVGLRTVAEGTGVECLGAFALSLYTSDEGFHSSVCRAATTLAAQSPEQEDVEYAMDLQPAIIQINWALRSLPAAKATCYRACRFPTSSLTGGNLSDVVRGHRHALDSYRPGSVVLWRHPASGTIDPALAEELALRGEPSAGCGVVFKIRRSLGARLIGNLTDYPEHGEVGFPANSCFRVSGLFPLTERSIRRGVAVGPGAALWTVDVGHAMQRNDSLSWDEATRAKNILVVLDEEDPSALQREAL